MSELGNLETHLEAIEAQRAPFDGRAHQRRVDGLLGLRRDEAGRAEGATLTTAGESRAHADIKHLVARTAEACGWRPTLEVAGEGWRADLMLELGGRQVAVEVQLAPQNHETYKDRHGRYRASGIDCVWLVAGYPDGYLPTPKMPLFRIGWPKPEVGEEGPFIGLPERERFSRRRRSEDAQALRLEDAVQKLLDGALHFSDVATVDRYVEFVGWEADCWRCGASESMSAWDVRALGLTACGLASRDEVSIHDHPNGSGEEHEGADVAEHFDRFSSTVRALALSRGLSDEAVKERYSRTAERSYPSFGCRSCDAIYGDWFVRSHYLDAVYEPPVFAIEKVPGQPWLAKRPHWCVVNADGCHCDSVVTAGSLAA